MAKQVSEILVKLGIQGADGLDKLKSSFRELEKAIGPSNATIEKARRSIIEFGDASDRTEQLIRGQLEAFRGLRSQAEIGSTTYNKLVSSIAQLETELRGSSAAIDNQREAILRSTTSSEKNADAFRKQIDALKQLQQQTRPGSSAFAQLGRDIDNARNRLTGLASEAQEFSRALNQGFGATPEKLSGQIAALRRGMVGLRFDSEKYLETLERIRLMTITQAGRTGRAEVIAGFQAYQNPTFTGGYASPGRLPELPNTTAALEQQLSELTAELANVERGSARYVDVANRMADIQRELRNELTGTTEAFRKLDIAQAGIERRSEKLAGIQEYYRTQGPLAPGVGGFRDPATGAMIMAGARTPGRIRVEEAAYQAPIGPQPFPEAGRRAQESIQRSLDDVNRIYEDARVRRVEIQSKYDQIHIDKLLEGLDLEGRVREKGFRDELAAFDQQLEARDRRRRRRLTAGQAVQAAGAVISGGIFGGAEGSLGGLGGAILGSAVPGLGTVGGAFAGAAIGAQVGMLRQQLGGFADYAAQIQKMQIALKGAAGTQEEFNRAMRAAGAATQNLNVPQDIAIQGMTRLTAAVKGAGGQVSDAEIVFNNVTSAIKATGGSAQDVDGAITAMVQVFSKGKVSAEELSGQLGERLPGAVTKFAKANNMTLPELQKALEQGQVGLNELMNFIVQLGDEYAGVAEQIAGSSQDSGARLTVAFNQMRIAVGEALQPIGAEFQAAFAEFIEKITPALVATLPKIAEAALGLARNLDVLAISAGAAFAVFAVGKIAAIGGVGAALLKLAAAAGTASVSLKALNAAALLNPWTALAAGIAAVGVSLYSTWKEQEQFNELLRDAPLDQITSEIDQLRQKLADLDIESRSASAGMSLFGGSAGFASAEAAQLRGRLDELISRQRELALLRNVGVTPKAGFYGPGFAPSPDRPTPTTFPRLTEEGGGSKKKAAKERESQLPQLMAELAVQQQIAEINARIRQAQFDGNEFLKIRLEGEKQIAEIAGQIRAIQFEKIPADEAEVKRKQLLLKVDEARLDTIQRLRELDKQSREEITRELDEISKRYTEQIEKARAIAEMVKSGITPALAEQYYEIDQTVEKEKELLEQKIAQLELTISSLSAESKIREELEKQVQATKDIIKARGEQVPKIKEKAKDEEDRKRREKEAADQAERLKAMYANIVGTLEDGIVGSLTAGIEALIGGTKTLGDALKEIASGILKDIGQTLLRFAVNLGMRAAFPGAFAAKGAFFAGGQADFAQNSIKPFATGGIVTRPTFFKYAKGGEMQNGLMGEAGPEAIMPLKRGADGKLGVAAKLDGAMGRYRRSPGSAGGPAGGGTDSDSGAGSAAMQPIDVRYSVERINNVDYVTADQFQQGMARAAQQGAVQGERRAMRSLKNSSATRRSVGI
jgi:tape measure domain-containing protein